MCVCIDKGSGQLLNISNIFQISHLRGAHMISVYYEGGLYILIACKIVDNNIQLLVNAKRNYHI